MRSLPDSSLGYLLLLTQKVENLTKTQKFAIFSLKFRQFFETWFMSKNADCRNRNQENGAKSLQKTIFDNHYSKHLSEENSAKNRKFSFSH